MLIWQGRFRYIRSSSHLQPVSLSEGCLQYLARVCELCWGIQIDHCRVSGGIFLHALAAQCYTPLVCLLSLPSDRGLNNRGASEEKVENCCCSGTCALMLNTLHYTVWATFTFCLDPECIKILQLSAWFSFLFFLFLQSVQCFNICACLNKCTQ